ncbi:Sec-independent protein translocase protein TatB [Desulfovibrio psychrotolerans]|uniref:Sec-independent protein translocase protein TatB n=1 Tax=Desulfovibrio psychrotolerans TaxID=415242 RepID=A0A7J0BQ01_9BACT|nr:Sec-independent protein translocase protein TatB [Desulfovibrio psychrotolerans]GFM35786.1 Sec-independent protein translocase protein TatB [Desulfovibrio psychrotolerans]
MFGIGTTEILVILVVALIVLGPKSLPKIARSMGKGLAEFRRVSTDFQRTINLEVDMEEHEKRKKEAAKRLYGDEDTEETKPKPKKKKKAAAKTAEAKTEKKVTGDLAVAPEPEQKAGTEPVDTDGTGKDPVAAATDAAANNATGDKA